jgi:phosphoglycerate dehydrogenase-like enzyme
VSTVAEGPFRLALSADFRGADGSISWGDIGLDELRAAGVDWSFLAEDDGTLRAEDIDGYDAVLFAAPAVTAETVSGANPPRLLARFGVGLDNVDVDACTRAGVAVTVTPDGARRALATAALSLVLAVAQRVVDKDRLVRTGRWEDKIQYMGRGLTGRTVGTLGLGGAAAELFGLLAPFETTNLATDPWRTTEEAAAIGVELVSLDELASRSDVLVVLAPLTDSTRRCVDARLIGLMRPHAVVVNVARGPIVDTDALVEALRSGRLFGAGLDVVDPEPLPDGHPLLELENVVLTPHALAWTDEMALGNGRSAIRAVLDLQAGRRPRFLVNETALGVPRPVRTEPR